MTTLTPFLLTVLGIVVSLSVVGMYCLISHIRHEMKETDEQWNKYVDSIIEEELTALKQEEQ